METLLIIAGVLVGLLILLVLIVHLSSRPASSSSKVPVRQLTWVVDATDNRPFGKPNKAAPPRSGK